MGTAATLYHSASGKLRSVLRKADYYAISLSCMAMASTVQNPREGIVGRTARLVSLVALPFRPSAVTACYASKMEVRH